MGILGQALNTPGGEPDDWFSVFEVSGSGDGLGAFVRVLPAEGYGDYFLWLVCDGRVFPPQWCPEGLHEPLEFALPWDLRRADHLVSATLLDTDDDGDLDLAEFQRDFEGDKAAGLRIEIAPVLENLASWNDAGQLENWDLSGVVRFANCYPGLVPTEARLDLELLDDAGTRTLNLYCRGTLVATGSRSGDGTIVLQEVNGSGISGEVEVTYTADVLLTDEAFVALRWPARYEIHADLAANWPLTFPRTPEAVVYDTGKGGVLAGMLTGLAAGSYSYLVRAVSDTEAEGTNTTAQETLALPGRPEPPGVPVLQSSPGNYTNTKIEFAKSPTVGVSYRYFQSPAMDEPADLRTEITPASESVGAELVSVTLPAYASGTGVREVVVVAVAGGIEDPFRVGLRIEYASGAIVPPRPNAPEFRVDARAGLAVSVPFAYRRELEAGIADDVLAYLYDAAGSLVATGTPQSLDPDKVVEAGTLTVTGSAAGWHTVLVKARTSGASSSSANVTRAGPFWLSAAAPAAPAVASRKVL